MHLSAILYIINVLFMAAITSPPGLNGYNSFHTSDQRYLTSDQRRELSQQLEHISPDATRFGATESYDQSNIMVIVERYYGKFDTFKQSFEYETSQMEK